MTPLVLRHPIQAMRYRRAGPHVEGRRMDLRSLCRVAQIPLRATAPERLIIVYQGEEQVRTPEADFVGVPVADLDSAEAALRALEALAHGFHDHAARACVCGRGLFRVPNDQEIETW